LSVLDEHFAEAWRATGDSYQRFKRRRSGLANYRIVRYADDFVVLVSGTKAHAETAREEVAAVLAPMGLRLSEAKTKVCHIDEGFDFLGFHIQRRRKRGTTKRVVYTYPSKKALTSIIGRVRTLTRRTSHPTLAAMLRQLNRFCWAGAPTSDMACRRRPSPTSTSTPGTEWWPGSADDTTRRSGTSSGTDSFRTGDPSRTAWCCSSPKRCRSPATAIGLGTSDRPGRHDHQNQSHNPSDTGSWRAGCVETRTSGSEGGMRKRNACKGVNAPHPDPTRRSRARPPCRAGSNTGRPRRGPSRPARGRWRT
jgi:hypothetical protein